MAFALAGVLSLSSLSGLSRVDAATAPTLSGRATVIDGDTLEIDGKRIRLEGIDAPETGQSCGRKWFGTWSCGAAASEALGDLVAGRRVGCERRGTDRYGRMIAVCMVDGRDINEAMVRSGYAWAFIKYSKSYVGAEAEAREARAGIWQGEAEPPWAFREKRWQTAETHAPKGCAIKGNVTGNGRIYHMPWGSWYAKVKVEEARGERWFCSEAEAQAAGWRPAST